MTDRRDLTVPDGTRMQVAVSALIKCLRRGEELEAYYWAKQLEARYPWMLWRRLRIFASEDVGLGDPHAAVLVQSLAETYKTLASERSAKWQTVDRSIIAHAVMYLARAEKSRETDDMLNAFEHLAGWGWRVRVPPHALDLHTDEGREAIPRSRRMRHWVEEASHVRPRVGSYDWRLWVLRWAAQRGLYSVEFVDRLAARWEREGRLRYGVVGYDEARFAWRAVTPEFDEVEPYDGDEGSETWQ